MLTVEILKYIETKNASLLTGSTAEKRAIYKFKIARKQIIRAAQNNRARHLNRFLKFKI